MPPVKATTDTIKLTDSLIPPLCPAPPPVVAAGQAALKLVSASFTSVVNSSCPEQADGGLAIQVLSQNSSPPATSPQRHGFSCSVIVELGFQLAVEKAGSLEQAEDLVRAAVSRQVTQARLELVPFLAAAETGRNEESARRHRMVVTSKVFCDLEMCIFVNEYSGSGW
jgi:hypothetical protein